MTRDDSGGGEATGEERLPPRSLSLGERVRRAARRDPTKGAFILLLLLLALGFLVAFFVVFGPDLLGWLI